jgi:hypothetical protein
MILFGEVKYFHLFEIQVNSLSTYNRQCHLARFVLKNKAFPAKIAGGQPARPIFLLIMFKGEINASLER